MVLGIRNQSRIGVCANVKRDLVCERISSFPGLVLGKQIEDCDFVVSQVWGLTSQEASTYILLLISQVQSVINN